MAKISCQCRLPLTNRIERANRLRASGEDICARCIRHIDVSSSRSVPITTYLDGRQNRVIAAPAVDIAVSCRRHLRLVRSALNHVGWPSKTGGYHSIKTRYMPDRRDAMDEEARV